MWRSRPPTTCPLPASGLGGAATLLLPGSTDPSGLVPYGARPDGGSSGVRSLSSGCVCRPRGWRFAGIPKDRGIGDEMSPSYINPTPVLVPSMRLHVRIRRSGALYIHLFDKLRNLMDQTSQQWSLGATSNCWPSLCSTILAVPCHWRRSAVVAISD